MSAREMSGSMARSALRRRLAHRLQRAAQVGAVATGLRVMGRIVRPDHQRHDVGTGEERCRLALAQRLQGAGQLGGGQVGDAGTGPAVADHVHRPPLAVGDVLREAVGQRVLGTADADASRGGVTEHDQAQTAALRASVGGCDKVVHVEAGVHRQELHPAQPHELHGHDAGEGADESAEHSCRPGERSIHAMTVANARG
jgi:hypothetical protein